MLIDKYINTIQCCDCLEGMRRLPDKCIDLIVTSPVIGRIAVIKTGGDHKINLFVAKIRTRRKECTCRKAHNGQQTEKKSRKSLHDITFLFFTAQRYRNKETRMCIHTRSLLIK